MTITGEIWVPLDTWANPRLKVSRSSALRCLYDLVRMATPEPIWA